MKKIKICIAAVCVICFMMPVHAQKSETQKKHHNVNLGFEVGSNLFFGDPVKPAMVRESKSYYNMFDDRHFYCGFIPDYQEMYIMYIGVKPEFFFSNNRLGLSTGLRFSKYSTALDSDRDYFLWLLNQDGVNTEYVKIRDITQNSYYLGIPFDFRFFLNKREKPAQFYFKIGSVFNFCLRTNNRVNFQNENMNIHTGTVVDQAIQSVQDFNAYMYMGMGLKIGNYKAEGRRTFPYINIEIHFFNQMLTEDEPSFIKTDGGVGIQLSVQIPLGKSVPIGTR